MTAWQKKVLLVIGLILIALVYLSNQNTEKKIEKMINKGRIQKAEEYTKKNSLSEKERIKAYLMLAEYYKKTGNEVETKKNLGKALVYYTYDNLNKIGRASCRERVEI